MTPKQLIELGDEFRDAVLKRTGIEPRKLVCPREKSEMTPCVARDGGICVIEIMGRPACVGCEFGIEKLLEKERSR